MKLKYLLVSLYLLSCTNAISQDYQLQINDTLINISVGEDHKVNLNGKTIKLLLISKDTLEFNNQAFTFKYPKGYSPSKHLIDSAVEQFTIISAEGSGIILQYYSSLNPESLNELMLREITKQSVEYGYELRREDYERDLKSGQQMRVSKAVLTYKRDVHNYEVATVGKKDEGLMVITINLGDKEGQGKKIIDLLWNTLQYGQAANAHLPGGKAKEQRTQRKQ